MLDKNKTYTAEQVQKLLREWTEKAYDDAKADAYYSHFDWADSMGITEQKAAWQTSVPAPDQGWNIPEGEKEDLRERSKRCHTFTVGTHSVAVPKAFHLSNTNWKNLDNAAMMVLPNGMRIRDWIIGIFIRAKGNSQLSALIADLKCMGIETDSTTIGRIAYWVLTGMGIELEEPKQEHPLKHLNTYSPEMRKHIDKLTDRITEEADKIAVDEVLNDLKPNNVWDWNGPTRQFPTVIHYAKWFHLDPGPEGLSMHEYLYGVLKLDTSTIYLSIVRDDMMKQYPVDITFNAFRVLVEAMMAEHV